MTPPNKNNNNNNNNNIYIYIIIRFGFIHRVNIVEELIETITLIILISPNTYNYNWKNKFLKKRIN